MKMMFLLCCVILSLVLSVSVAHAQVSYATSSYHGGYARNYSSYSCYASCSCSSYHGCYSYGCSNGYQGYVPPVIVTTPHYVVVEPRPIVVVAPRPIVHVIVNDYTGSNAPVNVQVTASHGQTRVSVDFGHAGIAPALTAGELALIYQLRK